MQFTTESIPFEALQFLRYSAFAGFLAVTVLIINLNNKAYMRIFKERARAFFWFFLLLSIIPLLAFFYVFNVLFGKLV